MNYWTETVQYLFTPRAARGWLYVAITTVAVYVLFGLAIFSYYIAYQLYVPYPVVELPLNLDFTCGAPQQLVEITGLHLASVPYHISLELDLPRDEYNQMLGNFMVKLITVNPSSTADPWIPSTFYVMGDERPRCPRFNTALAHSTANKPAILPYKSDLLETLDTSVFSLLYLFGWSVQKSILNVDLMDWSDDRHSIRSVFVKLDRNVHITSASLKWTVQWTGIRYFMYHYFYTTFFIGTWFFWFVETTFMLVVAWFVFRAYQLEDDLNDEDEPQEPYEETEYTETESVIESVETSTPTEKQSNSPDTSHRPQLDLLANLGPDPGDVAASAGLLTPAATPLPFYDDDSDYDERHSNTSNMSNMTFTSI